MDFLEPSSSCWYVNIFSPPWKPIDRRQGSKTTSSTSLFSLIWTNNFKWTWKLLFIIQINNSLRCYKSENNENNNCRAGSLQHAGRHSSANKWLSDRLWRQRRASHRHDNQPGLSRRHLEMMKTTSQVRADDKDLCHEITLLGMSG